MIEIWGFSHTLFEDKEIWGCLTFSHNLYCFKLWNIILSVALFCLIGHTRCPVWLDRRWDIVETLWGFKAWNFQVGSEGAKRKRANPLPNWGRNCPESLTWCYGNSQPVPSLMLQNLLPNGFQSFDKRKNHYSMWSSAPSVALCRDAAPKREHPDWINLHYEHVLDYMRDKLNSNPGRQTCLVIATFISFDLPSIAETKSLHFYFISN